MNVAADSTSRARALVLLVGLAFATTADVHAAEVWRLDNLERIGGHAVEVIGGPRVSELAGGPGIVFDGTKDGLFVPAIPFAGAEHFTIEILFRPEADGLRAQRFLHVQDTQGYRALIETRLDGRGAWYLDTFICTGAEETGVALVEPKNLHPTGRWYWAALRYDGKMMAHFVNGRKELERAANFKPITDGKISLGVRQNKVYWFKGAIREVRFHREALPDDRLQRGE